MMPSRDARQYTEVTTFPGLRTRFSLEEREEETAFINRAELIVKLLTGNTLSLQPKVRKVTTRDGERAVLKWGYTIILEFVLPESVAASAVIESKLMVTGHYEPYPAQSVLLDASTRVNLDLKRKQCPAN